MLMKKFEVYKNIRKRAVIFGLPVSLFAVMMISIVLSLLVIIFSFSFEIIVGILLANAVLYIALLRTSSNPHFFQLGSTFPNMISNKRHTNLHYEQD